MHNAAVIERMETIYESLVSVMDERMRRQWAAAEARAYGWGGLRAVCTAIGMSANTVRRGLQELAEREAHPEIEVSPRVRREGGGRKHKHGGDLRFVQKCLTANARFHFAEENIGLFE